MGVGIGGRQGTADVTYLVARSANDLESAHPDARRVDSMALLYFGKGVIDCRERKILAWNMDAEKRSGSEKGSEPATPRVSGPCPAPTGWKPGGPVVACAS